MGNSKKVNKKELDSRVKPRNDSADEKIAELTSDLQRLQADFVNFRNRADTEKVVMKQYGAEEMVEKLLPVFDVVERAIKNVPEDLKENPWVQGVEGLQKNLDKIFVSIGLEKIDASEGLDFNPELHHAVFMEEGEGEKEVIAEELQPGYKLNGEVLREATVKVKKV